MTAGLIPRVLIQEVAVGPWICISNKPTGYTSVAIFWVALHCLNFSSAPSSPCPKTSVLFLFRYWFYLVFHGAFELLE